MIANLPPRLRTAQVRGQVWINGEPGPFAQGFRFPFLIESSFSGEQAGKAQIGPSPVYQRLPCPPAPLQQPLAPALCPIIVRNRVSHQLAIAGNNTLLSAEEGFTRPIRYRALFKNS
jgi:hypothetical protein